MSIRGIGQISFWLALSQRNVEEDNMDALPKCYIKTTRDITGYWGAYPPSYPLAPGMIGKRCDGAFVRESHLNLMPGYDPVAHAVEDNAASDNPVSVWTTRRVKMQALSAEVASSVVPATVGIKIHFGGQNEAAIICNGNVYREFTDLRRVKDLMLTLLEKGAWNREYCLVTEVLVAKSAWIFFSTERDQTAEITADVPLELSSSALPVDIFRGLAGRAKLAASSMSIWSAGISTTLPEGGTPLFRAIRFNPKRWWRREDNTIDFLKGSDPDFEEQSFGEV
jgi:hypothetical protein